MAQHASSQKYTERDGFGHLELWSWKAQEWWHLYQTARALIKRWRIPAQQWLSMLSGSKITTEGVQVSHNCGVSVDVSRGVLANDTKGGFHPYHLLTLPKDDKVWEKEDFVRWKRDFCYLGYVVALYIRAGSLASAQTSSTSDASADLMLASQMLGSCREMDFLDRETWGLLSLDLDVNLLRVGVTDPPLPSSGARPPEMSRSFRAWRGMAEDLPSEYQNARQNLWHALSLSSHFRRAVEKKVALGFATGALTSYANSPRPVVRGRPVEVALFAMPVWYVTEFVAGLLLWRFPALAMQIWAAPLGGYNLPRSHELRPLVEPFLLEAPELRPLELIDGYCCDWQRVTFEVVRGALKQLATRLKTSSVLVCGGPLWVCLILHQAEPTLPLLAHCLTFQDLDLPLEFPENVRWVHEQVLRTFGKFGNGKAFLIQDDMQRVYYSMAFDFSMQNNFTSTGQISFFQMPYIQVRYSQRRAQELLFVREGTTKRWTNSLRGHLWYLKLQQLVADNDGRPGSTLRWRFLKDEAARIPYTEIAEHAAAVFFPGIGHAKLTLHELRTMGMPTFLPAKTLMYRVEELILDRRQPYSGSHDGCGESTAVRVTAPWVLELCGWRRHAYFMEWSSFYRYPYFFHFESIGHLLQLVNSMTLPELWALSVRMRKLNARLRAEEVRVKSEGAGFQGFSKAAEGRWGDGEVLGRPHPGARLMTLADGSRVGSGPPIRCPCALDGDDGACCLPLSTPHAREPDGPLSRICACERLVIDLSELCRAAIRLGQSFQPRTSRCGTETHQVCLLPDQCGGDQHVVAAGRLTAHEEAVATVGGPKVGDRGRGLWILFLVIAYVSVDVLVYFRGTIATPGYHKETLVITTSTVSIAIGALCAWWTGHRRALGQCFALKNVFNGWIFASSVCFSLSSINLLNAFDHLDGAFIKLVSQVKLPAAALVSTFVLRKRYSLSQWLTMLIICCACACFTALAAEAAGEAVAGLSAGLGRVSIMVLCNVFATLFAERAFKNPDALPFIVTMTNMRIGEVLFAVAFLVFGHGSSGLLQDFFLHWDATTLWVLAGHFADIWMTAFMVVQLSSVSKYVAKCITMVVLFGINIWKGYCSCNLQQVLVAAIVILATLQFSSLGSERTRKERLEGSTAESRRKCSRVVEFRAGVPRA
ncbi:unnamed protein product [Durusdinium trenchii]|uniref:Sugar phosphate transporter domain-containing protein n=1 Tax=Durusdinium trenchii TaxID=1381693 RepID=A0ABP0P1D3_9DINO